MPLDQLIFSEVIVADECNRAARDKLRSEVADFFSSLTPRQRDALGSWVSSTAQYDMFVALAAEAGSWEEERRKQLFKCLSYGGIK